MKCPNPKCDPTGYLVGSDQDIEVNLEGNDHKVRVGKAWVGTCVVCGDTYAKIEMERAKVSQELLSLLGNPMGVSPNQGVLTKIRSRVDSVLSVVSPFPGAPDKEFP